MLSRSIPQFRYMLQNTSQRIVPTQMNIVRHQFLVLQQQRMFAWTPIQKPFRDWKIVRDDQVVITTGTYSGQQGKVMKVFRKKNSVLVKGVNLKYKMIDDEEGVRRRKMAQIEHPVHVSNVSLIDP